MWNHKIFIKDLNSRKGCDKESEISEQLIQFLNIEKIDIFQVLKRKIFSNNIEILEIIYKK